MRTVAIIAKPQKERLIQVLPELVHWLRAHGLEPQLDDNCCDIVRDVPNMPRERLNECSPELGIVLGGDGTVLAAARVFARQQVPLLCVNLGSLGFLTEARISDLYPSLEAWVSGTGKIEERTMLNAQLLRSGTVVAEFDALNDVVLSKGAIARISSFIVRYQGRVAASFRSDGVIVSTPTGSTAYTLSANGPILVPEMDAFVVTPVCPHLLTIRPIVFPGNAKLSVTLDANTPSGDAIYLTVDGQEAVEVRPWDEVLCQRSHYAAKFVRHPKSDSFFDVLRSKLKWSER
jgi:NAD+ kinase